MTLAPPNQTRSLWLARVSLLAAVLIVGARSFGFDYVEFDDPRMFYDNPYIHELSAANLRWMFTDASYNNHFYTPLLWLFYALSGRILTFSPQPQHVLNILLHAANTWLVFEVLRQLVRSSRPTESTPDTTRDIWAPLIAALFWALHPLRVEATGWISARVHLHAALFAFAATWFYCRARQHSANRAPTFKRGSCWAAVILYGLSVLSFPTAVTLPAALAVLDWYLFKTHASRKPLQRLLKITIEIIPFILVAAIPAFISFASNMSADKIDQIGPRLPFLEHVAAICYVLWIHLYTHIIPVALAPTYTTLMQVKLSNPVYIISLLMIPTITLAAFLFRRRVPALWCGWLCYVLLMIPYVGLAGPPSFTSDRYSYVSAVVWSALLAGLFIQLCQLKSSAIRRATTLVISSILIAISTLSIMQIGIWRDSPTLFHALIARIGNHPHRAVPMWRLGLHYLIRDNLDAAAFWADQAWSIQKHPTVELGRLRILVRRCQLAESAAAPRETLARHYADLLSACRHIEFPENQATVAPVAQAASARLSILEAATQPLPTTAPK